MPWVASFRAWPPRRKQAALVVLNGTWMVVFWFAAAGLVAPAGERFCLIVPWVYAAGVMGLVLAGERRPAKRRGLIVGVVALGLVAVLFYDHHHPSATLVDGERPVLAYAAVGALLLAGWLYRLVQVGVAGLMRVKSDSRRRLAFAAQLVTILIYSIVLTGCTMGILQSHFPKLRSEVTPQMLRRDFEPIRFQSRGGLTLAGWFVPAEHSDRTAIVCHGVGAYKADMLDFIEALAEGGYNVLAFDFRGHGESDGHSISFGAKEQYDVRAAIDWVKAAHPERARRIVGVGWSMGAVSLILAAADDTRIEALHLDAPYARTRDIARVIARPFPPVYRQVSLYVGLAVASLDAGANLFALAPVNAVGRIAPRPILIVHGTADQLIPIEQGRMVFAAAGEPKRFVEIPGAGHCGTIGVDTPNYQRRMLEFLNGALAEDR